MAEVKIEARVVEVDLELIGTAAGREVTPVAVAGAVLDLAEVGVPGDAEDTLHHIPADLLQDPAVAAVHPQVFPAVTTPEPEDPSLSSGNLRTEVVILLRYRRG